MDFADQHRRPQGRVQLFTLYHRKPKDRAWRSLPSVSSHKHVEALERDYRRQGCETFIHDSLSGDKPPRG